MSTRIKSKPIDEFNEQDLISNELESSELEQGPPPDLEIVEKYEEGQARIIIQRNDFLIPNILQMVKDRDVLNLSPEYQRRKRWSEEKRSRLIESLLMNIPVPPIFLYEKELAQYEVMDGQQRLDAIRGFFNSDYPLQGLAEWSVINGLKYEELPLTVKRGLQRRGLAAVIILTESGPNKSAALRIRQNVFERLNTGGEKLNAQEVRNCIYASEFNKMLIRIARSKTFTEVWGVPPKEPGEPYQVSEKLRNNQLYSRMDDCQIVLRFFALSDMDRFESGMKATLDNCMVRNLTLKFKESSLLERRYLRILKYAKEIYGETLFRLPTKAGQLNGRRSVPLADSVMLGILNTGASAAQLVSHSEYILRRTRELLSDPEKYQVLVGRGNTKSEIQTRIKLMTKVFKQAINRQKAA
jgi:hypothetical protein